MLFLSLPGLETLEGVGVYLSSEGAGSSFGGCVLIVKVCFLLL
jgi:hypothetical protein